TWRVGRQEGQGCRPAHLVVATYVAERGGAGGVHGQTLGSDRSAIHRAVERDVDTVEGGVGSDRVAGQHHGVVIGLVGAGGHTGRFQDRRTWRIRRQEGQRGCPADLVV